MEIVRTLTNDGKICNKNKELVLKTSNVAIDEKTCYYFYKNVWYDMLTPALNVEQIILSLSNDDNFIFETIKRMIKDGMYINPIFMELCNAANIEGAEESNKLFSNKIEERKKHWEELKQKKEEEQKQSELELTKNAENYFKNGHHIKTETFELLCKKYGVKMHPRTVSCLRRYISEVSINSLKLFEKCNTEGVSKTVKLLYNKLNS